MKETTFKIDICGDCVYFGECDVPDKFSCRYSLLPSELMERVQMWYYNIEGGKSHE